MYQELIYSKNGSFKTSFSNTLYKSSNNGISLLSLKTFFPSNILYNVLSLEYKPIENYNMEETEKYIREFFMEQ